MATIPTFYANQETAATNILAAFQTGEFSYALLCAEMQSGKTGTFQALARKCLISGLVDRTYIICGSAEVVLRSQAIKDTQKYNSDLVDRITVHFRQNFSTTVMNTHRSLIIVDESHLDSSYGSQMMLFLGRHGLTLQGTSPAMIANQTYICSVSATPYAEYAKICDKSSLPKHVEFLQPSPSYYGLLNYMADGLLRPTFNIAEDPDQFRDLLEAVAAPKWILLRAVDTDTIETVRALCSIIEMPIMEYTSAKKDIGITREEALELGISPVRSLDDPPLVPTIVHMKGTCRVGKVLPKRHIAFVWEDTKAPHTDTSVQALPGRMCGDASAFGDEKPVIYVSPKILEGRLSVLTLNEGDDNYSVSELDRHSALTDGRAVVPTKGMNIASSKLPTHDEDALAQTPPFLVNLSMVSVTGLTPKKIFTYVANHLSILTSQPSWSLLTASQQDEILEYLSQPVEEHTGTGDQRTLRCRRLKASNKQGQMDYFLKIIDAHSLQTTAEESGYDWDLSETTMVVNIVETLKPTDCLTSLPASVRCGHVYCVFYTHASPKLDAIHVRSRIPETKRDTIFDAFALTDELIRATERCDNDDPPSREDAPTHTSSSSVASSVSAVTRTTGDPASPVAHVPAPALSYWYVPLAPEATLSPDLLRTFLMSNIQGTSGVRDIKPAFALSKSAYHFTGSQKKNNDLCRILKEIGDARGLKLTFECGTGADYATYFYVKKVSWSPK